MLVNSSSSSCCSLAVLSLPLINATITPLFIYVNSNSIRIKAMVIHEIIMIVVFPESRWGDAVELTVFSVGVVCAIVVAVILSLLQFRVVPKT